jgi:hypothetical protein
VNGTDGRRKSAHAAPPRPATKPRKPAGYLFPLEPAEPAPAEPVASPAPAAPSTPASAWLDRLVKSPAYQAQRQMVRRFVPEDEVVLKVLSALDAQGGAMTPAALAHRAGCPPARLDGLVAKIQRLLNVDGYEVLRLDRRSDVVVLNADLLRRQFELG